MDSTRTSSRAWTPMFALTLALTVACGDDESGESEGTEGTTAASTASTATAATAASTGDTSTGGDGSLAQLCVDTINMYRATLGKPAYLRWTDAETCADAQAKSDAMSGTAHGAFGECEEWAQNECPGWDGGDPSGSITGCLASMWAEGPGADFSSHGHYINMSSDDYTKVACGFYTTGDGQLWAVQDFQ